ncbi:MAG: SRPBCC family protein [Acidimicrobiales bacterium]
MTDNSNMNVRILGRLLRLDGTRGAVRVEDVYDTGIDDLWSAITNPSRLARWLATVEGDLRVGGKIYARFSSSYEGPGRIDLCDPPRQLLVTFEPGTSDEGVTEAVLTPLGEKTHLMIEQRGIPFGNLPDHGAGWQAHLEDLSSFLSGGPDARPDAWRSRWSDLSPIYQRLFQELPD